MVFMIVQSSDDIFHHGIKGQRWGVRRYQNYDGSYTKKGLERYNKASEKYQTTKEGYKAGTATKSDVRAAKKEEKQAYKQLKQDYLADQGKELYRTGHTITANDNLLSTMSVGTGVAAAVTQRVVSQYADEKMANISAAAIGAGGLIVTSILEGKNAYQNKRLRAYYAH